MSDSPLDLDLKFLPDWLKEPADKNPYADYAGESPRRDFDRRSGGGNRGPGNRGPGGNRPQQRSSGGPQGRPGARDERGGGGPRRDSGRPAGSQGPRGPREVQGRPGERRPERYADQRPPAPRPEEILIPLNIEFLPEPESVAALAQQIKTSHKAYPIYGLGRMFLNKPERHRVRVTSNAPAHPLYQVGAEGAVTTNRQAAEREAFRACKASYYVEETQQLEPPKGNYTNVGRCRLSGVLLGPTNHHGYQPALRRLYEARFSRRMDFNEFLRQVEVVSDPAIIEEWKKQVSSVTVFRTTQEAESVEFKTAQDVEAHFRAHYLEKCLRSGKSLEMSGIASRNVGDRQIRDAIRSSWEKERGFPAQTVNRLRPYFQDAGLHIWKHRKRILFVSTVRPVRFGSEAQNVSKHIADILNIIEASPKCTRADFSTHLLKPQEAEPDFQKIKAALASDLHWLIGSGHVIEFHDGTFELPLAPKEAAKEEAETKGNAEKVQAIATPVAEPAAAEVPVAEVKVEIPVIPPCGELAESAPESPITLRSDENVP
ncbi:MAG: collagen-like protein [Verrucomicrobiota bacterium]